MINLISKDLKLLFYSGGSRKERTGNLVFQLLFYALLLALEIFLFQGVLNKVTTFDGASQSFLTLFLFVVLILMCVLSLVRAEKILFDENDRHVIRSLPLRRDEIVFAKVSFLLVLQLAYDLFTAYPLFVIFGALIHKIPFFYFESLFYCLCSAFFEVGIALLLVYPYHKIKVLLSRHPLAAFLTAIVLLFGISLFYSYVLDLFLALVSQNEVITLFSEDNLLHLRQMTAYFYPVSIFLDAVLALKGWDFFASFLLTLTAFYLGGILASFSYRVALEENQGKAKKHKEKNPTKPWKALVWKEFALLFRSSDSFFSFSGLLVVSPFFAYLVIRAMNAVFRSGMLSYYVSLFPSFLALLDIGILLLIYVTILSGGDEYIGIEKTNLKTMKVLPVSPLLQLGIKLSLPYASSMASLLVTLLVLCLTHEMSAVTAVICFLAAMIFLAVASFAALYEELKRTQDSQRNHFISSLYDWGVPLVLLIFSLVLSFYRVPRYAIYLIDFALLLLSALPFVLHLPKRVNHLFLTLEPRS